MASTCLLRWVMSGACALPLGLVAQSAPPAALVGGPSVVRPGVKKWTLKFSDEKPVVGLPADASRSHVQCDSHSVTFFGVSDKDAFAPSTAASLPELYSLAEDGELKRVPRKSPLDAASVSLLDFFVADHTLVSLVEADGRAGDDSEAASRNRRYLLSLSDHDGDGATLVELSAHFKPLKVAMFGSGKFLVLGWDELNLQPALALVNEDGSIRRFFDLESTHTYRANSGHAEAPVLARKPLEQLRDAVFVPWGTNVLLTFPGTREGLQLWNEMGEGYAYPIAYPPDTVLHDVVSTNGSIVVLRAKPVPQAEAKVSPPPPLRLLEFNIYNGLLLREPTLEGAKPDDVACAVRPHVTAIYLDTLPDASAPAESSAGASPPADPPKRLVVATAPF